MHCKCPHRLQLTVHDSLVQGGVALQVQQIKLRPFDGKLQKNGFDRFWKVSLDPLTPVSVS